MSNYNSIKAIINANVKTNGKQEISGSVLNSVLNAMVNALGAGYQYAGVATPDTNPGTPDTNVVYIAATAGTYAHMGGLAVAEGEVAILKYNGTWAIDVTGAATAEQAGKLGQDVSQLGQKIDGVGQNYILRCTYKVDGSISGDPDWFIGYEYIPVKNGDTIVWNPGSANSGGFLIVYNSNKERINFYIANAIERTITLHDSDAAFIRPSFAMDNLSSAKIIKNGVEVWSPAIREMGVVPKEEKTELALGIITGEKSLLYSVQNGTPSNFNNTNCVVVRGRNTVVLPGVPGHKYRLKFNKTPHDGYNFYFEWGAYTTDSPTSFVANRTRTTGYVEDREFVLNSNEYGFAITIAEKTSASSDTYSPLRESDFSADDICILDVTDSRFDASQKLVTEKITEVGQEVSKLNDIVSGSKKNYAIGGWNTKGENAGSSSWYRVLDYIPVSPGDTIIWNPGVVNGGICLPVYDSNKTRIGFFGANAVERTLTMPSGAAYIRPSFAVSTFENAKIIRNGVNVWYAKEDNIDLAETVEQMVPDVSELKMYRRYFDGAGTSYSRSSKIYNIIPGAKYRLYVNKALWQTPTVSGVHLISVLYALNGAETTIVYKASTSGWGDYLEFTAPAQFEYIVVGGRAIAGTRCYFEIVQMSPILEFAPIGSPYILRNGTLNNLGNANYITTEVINTCGRKLLGINITRPNTAGYHYRFIYALTSSYDDIGSTVISTSWHGRIFYREGVEENTFDISNYPSAVGFGISITEVDANGNSNPLRITDFSGYKIELVFFDDSQTGLETQMRDYAFNSVFDKTNIEQKCRDYSALLNNSGAAETLVFMTDPHLLGLSNNFDANTFKQYIGLLQKYYNMLPIDWMVCGGDWLNNNDYQAVACWKLGYMDATMRKLFKHYFPVLGNHDTNYQGVVSADDSSRGDLTHQTLVNLMFRENGNTYYKFKGNNTQFYVFDTGIDWETEMNAFKWAQIDWFAQNLISDDPEHTVIIQHIYYNSGTTVNPMATNIQAVAGAYNSRSSVTLNGITYDFSGRTGKIACVIAGHSHFDAIVTEGVSVPVWLTTNMMDGSIPTFDLCIIDYTAGKMKSVRIGTGENREMTLA